MHSGPSVTSLDKAPDTENQNQASYYPFVLLEFPIPTELALIRTPALSLIRQMYRHMQPHAAKLPRVL